MKELNFNFMKELNFKKFFSHNQKPTKIGDYKIVYINAKKFRDSSLENEEFCNVAIHEDFPKHIKKNEIYIDKNISIKEIPSFLKGIMYRLKKINKNLSSKKVYLQSLKKEKTYRKEHSSKLKKEFLFNLSEVSKNIKIYFVDGKAVRDNYKTDFSQGGHGYVYDWIPENEIWLEKEEENELFQILIHEYTERYLMKYLNYPYHKAHDFASKIEMNFRKNNYSLENLF